MLSELPVPPAEASCTTDAATAAGCALLLALGWEEQQPGGAGAHGREVFLHAAVALVFGDQDQSHEAAGVVRGTSGAEAEEEAWQRPMVRWCLAALLQRYCAAAGPEANISSDQSAAARSDAPSAVVWRQPEARQLAQAFAASSYGDMLFGAAVALLLRSSVPLDAQVGGQAPRGCAWLL
jgi:hypothetical protein